jgi:aldehyde dehydrogenase (NAD+)
MGRGSVVGETLIRHPDVAAIPSRVGCDRPGHRRGVRRGMKKFQLEMGGQESTRRARRRRSRQCGRMRRQRRLLCDRPALHGVVALVVTEGIHDRFVGALTERMKSLVIDDALKAVRTSARRRREPARAGPAYIDIGKARARRLVAGGER